ncbi:hypothetical protein PEPS_00450 [Persicobacter psychrovividus]|uniref:Putative auto-transporter adhesin head GIN domain-containing protein n=1 Tax=Persicobacter psychrovividus TaxID=387638 RepID=A0ABM7VAP4_9BACT|nr:hypothetical protein PEPS_00450 [Persicobacter psychrovividus]
MEKFSIFKVFVFLCLAGICFACEQNSTQIVGKQAELLQELPPFCKLSVDGNFAVELQPANAPSAHFIGAQEAIDSLQIDWRGDSLLIYFPPTYHPLFPVKVCLDYQSINGIVLKGKASLESPQPLIFRQLAVTLTGWGSLDLVLDALRLSVEMQGAGDVLLEGRARHFSAEMNGAGSLKATKLEVNNGRVSVNGIGGAMLSVTDSLQAEVNGIGGILCKQRPKMLRRKVLGAGKIEIKE